MSSEALRWAWKQDLTSGSKFVLVLLGDYADEVHSLNPRINWMSQKTGMSRTAVKDNLKVLRDRGLVRWEYDENERGQQQSNRYFLAVDGPFFEVSEDEQVATTQGGVGIRPQSDSGYRSTTSSIATSSSSVRETSSLFLQTPRPPAQRPEADPTTHYVKALSARRQKRRAAEAAAQDEAAADPFAVLGNPAEPSQEPLAAPPADSETPQPSRGRQRAAQSPDSSMGLAYYFRDASLALGWGAEPANLAALAKKFTEWKANGITPDTIRSMVDRYVSDAGMRNDRAVPWTDFLAKRALLLDGARREVEAERNAADRGDAASWLTPHESSEDPEETQSHWLDG